MKKIIYVIMFTLFTFSCMRAPVSLPNGAEIKERDEYIVYEHKGEIFIYNSEYGLFKKISD